MAFCMVLLSHYLEALVENRGDLSVEDLQSREQNYYMLLAKFLDADNVNINLAI